MTSGSGSRAELRVRQINTIKAVAKGLIARKGVGALSLREISREMGLVSSALYRYFATRDELVTALILDAYNELGAHVEVAESKVARHDARGRWRATCLAVRHWATANPHEFALLYGTPLPGYVAPEATIAAASRVVTVMGRILSDVAVSRRRRTATASDAERYLEVEKLAAVMPNVPAATYLRALMAWTQVYGSISFELFGHYEGSVTNADVMFQRVVEELADFVGIGPEIADRSR